MGVSAEVSWLSTLGTGSGTYEAATAADLDGQFLIVTLSSEGATIGSAQMPLAAVASGATHLRMDLRGDALIASLTAAVIFEEIVVAAVVSVGVAAIRGAAAATATQVRVSLAGAEPADGSVISILSPADPSPPPCRLMIDGAAAEILPRLLSLLLLDAAGATVGSANFPLYLYGGRGEAVPFTVDVTSPDSNNVALVIGDVKGHVVLTGTPRFAQMVGGTTIVKTSAADTETVDASIVAAFIAERPRYRWRPQQGNHAVVYERALAVRAEGEGTDLTIAPQLPVNTAPPPVSSSFSSSSYYANGAPALDALVASAAALTLEPPPATLMSKPPPRAAKPIGTPPPLPSAPVGSSAVADTLPPPLPTSYTTSPAPAPTPTPEPAAATLLPWFWEQRFDANGFFSIT